MDAKNILEIAQRAACRYKKSSDPHHSDTFTFNERTLIDFVKKVSTRPAPCAKFCEAQAFKIQIRQLMAEVERLENINYWQQQAPTNQPQNRRTGDIKIAEPADVLPEFK